MATSTITLTVYFEDPFWVGVVERCEGERIQAARHLFGAEPLPGEVLEFVQRRLLALLDQATPAAVAGVAAAGPRNPKRAAREAARALASRGGSTQAHEAMRLQIEQNKCERAADTRAERAAAEGYRRATKLRKAKARHRGHA